MSQNFYLYSKYLYARQKNHFYKDIQNLHEFRFTIKINTWIAFRIKEIIIHCKSNNAYRGGQATFYGGHKITVFFSLFPLIKFYLH